MALPVLEAGRGGDVDRADADKSSASSGATARAAVVRVICRKPRMTPSRDYDEQRLGILYSLLKSEYLR